MPARSPLLHAHPLGLLAATLVFAASTANASWPDAPPRRHPWDPPEKRPLPLRLDEAPELPLLRPFRDPKGPPATSYATWRTGPWAQWRERLWFPLASEVSPPLGRDLTVDAWLARQSEQPLGFPLQGESERDHWFVRRGDVSPRSLIGARLAVEERWVPPWLQRLDPDWANELLGVAGCGRGGRCSETAPFPGEAFVELWTAMAPVAAAIPESQCREQPTTIGRFGGEHASFLILRCDGSLADGALARLSVLARPQNVAAVDSLPDEPEPSAAANGEWVPGVRLLDPRLAWVIARVGAEFKGHAIYVYSGYRPTTRSEVVGFEGTIGHGSQHGAGRALDISVEGISNEELLAFVFELPDTGCGYYPRSRFVHVDVRPRSSGSSVWIDGSSPGEKSVFFPEWQGVVEKGRVVWKKT
jgi:hypothetical protein